MTSWTFCTQALANTGHLFIRTFQWINRPLVRAIVSRRTGETCRLVILVIKCSRFTFEFKPKTFGTKGTTIATKRLNSASIAIISRWTDERLGHDLMWTIKARLTWYAFIRRIVSSSVCSRTTLKRVVTRNPWTIPFMDLKMVLLINENRQILRESFKFSQRASLKL